MAVVHLDWREVAGDLPPVCVLCGAPASHIVSWRLAASRRSLFSTLTRFSTARLPMCPDHLQPVPSRRARLEATEITADEVILKNVAEEFVEALRNYRIHRARQRRSRRDPEEDWEEEEQRRWRREQLNDLDPMPEWAGTAGKLILIAFGVIFLCAGGMAVLMFLFLRLRG
jgi:hypothetical protein